MKTREQIYGQEAAGILRDVSMYRALTELSLIHIFTWAVLNGLGFIMSYVTPFFSGGQWTAP